MVYANKVSTVSSTYANEITTEEYGEGLHNLLRARQNDLLGIVNGISYITGIRIQISLFIKIIPQKQFTRKRLKTRKSCRKS